MSLKFMEAGQKTLSSLYKIFIPYLFFSFSFETHYLYALQHPILQKTETRIVS